MSRISRPFPNGQSAADETPSCAPADFDTDARKALNCRLPSTFFARCSCVKDVLSNYPDERQRWFDFQSERERRRIVAWLESIGVSPIET